MSDTEQHPIFVHLRLRDPSYERNGTLYLGDPATSSVEFKLDESCEHATTMCGQCVGSWRTDHEVTAIQIVKSDGVTTLTTEELSRVLGENE